MNWEDTTELPACPKTQWSTKFAGDIARIEIDEEDKDRWWLWLHVSHGIFVPKGDGVPFAAAEQHAIDVLERVLYLLRAYSVSFPPAVDASEQAAEAVKEGPH